VCRRRIGIHCLDGKVRKMEIIYKPRQLGKTTEIIKLSAKNGGYIVCMSHSEAERVFQQARTMKLNIPFPITFHEFITGEYYGKGIKSFLIDNAEILLQQISRVPIEAISFTIQSSKESVNK